MFFFYQGTNSANYIMTYIQQGKTEINKNVKDVEKMHYNRKAR